MFGYFLLLAYFINKTIIEPLNARFNSESYRSYYDTDIPVFIITLMLVASIATVIASLKRNAFKNGSGQFFGIVTSIFMIACAYFLSAAIGKSKPDIEPEFIVLCFGLLGIVAIAYFAVMNIYDERGFKAFGFISLISYIVLIGLLIATYFEIYSSARSFYFGSGSSHSSIKELLGALKVFGIIFVGSSIVSFILSIVYMVKPAPQAPDEYQL